VEKSEIKLTISLNMLLHYHVKFEYLSIHLYSFTAVIQSKNGTKSFI